MSLLQTKAAPLMYLIYLSHKIWQKPTLSLIRRQRHDVHSLREEDGAWNQIRTETGSFSLTVSVILCNHPSGKEPHRRLDVERMIESRVLSG